MRHDGLKLYHPIMHLLLSPHLTNNGSFWWISKTIHHALKIQIIQKMIIKYRNLLSCFDQYCNICHLCELQESCNRPSSPRFQALRTLPRSSSSPRLCTLMLSMTMLVLPSHSFPTYMTSAGWRHSWRSRPRWRGPSWGWGPHSRACWGSSNPEWSVGSHLSQFHVDFVAFQTF